jgi:hypothetical protein
MFPKLRVIVAAMLATCVAVLLAAAGLVGTRDPGKHVTDVPDVSRAFVQQAAAQEPAWQHFQLLAYTRRADELLRLRDLPVTRAVVEYAERAQAEAAAASAPATPPAEAVVASIPAAPVPPAPPAEAAVASAPTATATEPAEASVNTAATQIETPAETVPAAPPVAAPAPTEPTSAPATPGSDAQVAAVQSGTGATASVHAPETPKVGAKRHRAKAAASKPKKKVRVIRAPASVPPVGTTGFPVDPPRTSGQGATNTQFGANRDVRR